MTTLPWGADPVADMRHERLQTSPELKRLVAHFELVRKAPTAYLMVDGQGAIVRVNEAAEALFAQAADELIDGSLSDISANDAHLPLFTCLDETISTGQLCECTAQLHDTRAVRWTLHPLAAQGDGAEYCLVSCHVLSLANADTEFPRSDSGPIASFDTAEHLGPDSFESMERVERISGVPVGFASAEHIRSDSGVPDSFESAEHVRSDSGIPDSFESMDRAERDSGIPTPFESAEHIRSISGPPDSFESSVGMQPDSRAPASLEYFDESDVLPSSTDTPGLWSDSGVLVRPAHLLIADQDMERRAALLEMLETLGATSSTADNGAEALEKLKGHHFDGVIIDLHLPVLNGFETVEWIRRDPALQHLKVLATTSGAFRHEEDACYAAGCDLFQATPCPAEALKNQIRSLLTSIEAAHDIYDQRSYS